ncbi:MAG: serine/threonine protein kinase [Myxococcales bacterium]|nr:serine/threonine protein kinase [Myxococcales bacterium]
MPGRGEASTGPPEALADLEREAIQRRIGAALFGEQAPPVRIGRFVVQEVIGRGGMGVVYAAHDERLARAVAIKVISDPEGRPGEHDRVLAEARAQARLSHPNVVQVYEVGEAGDDVFVVMEIVRGTTLDRWLDGGPRPLAARLAAFLAAGRGLAAAHAAGLVHRDIKPGNILIGDDGRVCIADFGLARGTDGAAAPEVTTRPRGPGGPVTRTSTHAFAGTPAYMSPEHLRGCPDARSDQFSFCVALYEAVYARRPFAVDDVTRVPRHRVAVPFPATSGAPRWLRRALARGLALDPERRFPGMPALLAELEAGPRRRRRLAVAAVAVAAAVVAGARLTAPSSVCPLDQQAFAGVWDGEARDAVRRAMTASGEPYAARAWHDLAGALDEYTAGWRVARQAACEATEVRRERTREARARSDECLERVRRSLATRVTRLRAADRRQVAAVDEWVASLPDPRACVDPERLAWVGFTAPSEPIQLGLDHARLLQRTHQGRAALPTIEQLLRDSQSVGDGAGEAEALLLRARVEAFDLGDSARALKTLEHAHASAAAATHDAALWQISQLRALIAARELEDPVEARMWLTRARSERARLGRDPRVDADLLITEAAIAVLEQRFDGPPRCAARPWPCGRPRCLRITPTSWSPACSSPTRSPRRASSARRSPCSAPCSRSTASAGAPSTRPAPTPRSRSASRTSSSRRTRRRASC